MQRQPNNTYIEMDEGDVKIETTSPSAPVGEKLFVTPGGIDLPKEFAAAGHFTRLLGDLPFRQPNIFSLDDLKRVIPESSQSLMGSLLCCLTGIGACYVCCNQVLIKQGEIGIVMNNGQPELLLPGRVVLVNPLKGVVGRFSLGDDNINAGPVTIARVPQGCVGFAFDSANPEILLPGVHARNSAQWKFVGSQSLNQDLITFGPIKILTVNSGGVRVCYSNGRVAIYPEGRYGINSATFQVGGHINTQQQNLRFREHPVLLDGGISMLIQGLLTYQVVDVERLIHQLGNQDLVRAIEDVTKAELARVFASLHLEQISAASSESVARANYAAMTDEEKATALLGDDQEKPGSHEGETRMWVCHQVIRSVSPIASSWGINIINFQLESTKIADETYAKEYEAASLAMAKAKANLRAVNAQNQITLLTAQAQASALKIGAEGRKTATIIEAEGQAEARKIEARARNEAAEVMVNEFGREYAMAGQQVEFAKNLRANTLALGSGSGVANMIMAKQPMLAGQGDEQ